MDANVPYLIIQYAAAKNQQGYISPAQYDLIINQGQRGFCNYLLGEYQQYQLRRPIAVVEFGQNERIRDSISPLIYSAILPINSTTGIAARPSDYEYPDNMWSIYGNYNIKFIQQDRLDSYNRSTIDPIGENPVYLIQHEGFHFFPERPYGENQAKLSYVRIPPSIHWGYTLDSNSRPVYNAATSQAPVWSDTDMMDVIARALQFVGINLQSAVISQYAQEIKKGGQ